MPASTGPQSQRTHSQPIRQLIRICLIVDHQSAQIALPDHAGKLQHIHIVEAFAGGVAVLFAREPTKVEVLNDMHGELMRLYRVVANHLHEFMRHFR